MTGSFGLQVRDRATIHLAELTKPDVPSFLKSTWEVPPDHLQVALEKYMDEGDFSQPFNLVRIPHPGLFLNDLKQLLAHKGLSFSAKVTVQPSLGLPD